MNIDWMKVGREFTEGIHHEWEERFNKMHWEPLPAKPGFSQGIAFKEIIREFNLNASHIGEYPYHHGAILGVRAKFKQGVAEVFVHDDGNQTITTLAVRKFWRD